MFLTDQSCVIFSSSLYWPGQSVSPTFSAVVGKDPICETLRFVQNTGCWTEFRNPIR